MFAHDLVGLPGVVWAHAELVLVVGVAFLPARIGVGAVQAAGHVAPRFDLAAAPVAGVYLCLLYTSDAADE